MRTVLSNIEITVLKETKSITLLLLLGLSGIQLLLVGFWMIRYHPHQSVYFNQIGYRLGREKFERDYWRISIKEGIEYLLANDSSENISICMETQFEDPEYLMILPEDARTRIHIITDPIYYDACDYTVNTYRNPDPFECESKFHEIEIDGLLILSVTKCFED